MLDGVRSHPSRTATEGVRGPARPPAVPRSVTGGLVAVSLALAACGSDASTRDPAPPAPTGDSPAAIAGTSDRSGTPVPAATPGPGATIGRTADGTPFGVRSGPEPSGPGPEAPPVIDPDALAGALDDIPPELALVVDPTLLEEGDPPDFPVSATVGGDPVEVLREVHPTSGNLTRIALIRPRPADDADAVPVLHGPQWRYHDTAALRSVQWFLDGVAHGPVRQWRRVGTMIFEGRFHHGERDGLRREYAKNGTLISTSVYVRGVQWGEHVEAYATGERKSVANYVDGQLDGKRRVWAPEGILLRDERYRDGVLDGRWSDFHPVTGQPHEWGSYEEGRRVGIWQRGDAEGAVLASVPYEAGRPHGRARIWNEDGTLVEEYEYVEGEKTGTCRTWYADGTPQSEGRLDGGMRVGRWMYWKSDGTVNARWSGTYEDDRRTAGLDG